MTRGEIKKMALMNNRGALESYIRANKNRANKNITSIQKTFGTDTYRSRALNVSRETLSNIGLKKYGGKLNKLTIDQLEEQALSLSKFLDSSTSTVRGVRKRERHMLQYFTETGRTVDVKDRDKFFEILSSDIAQEYYKIDSGEVIQSAANWANTPDFDVSLLDKIWNRYVSGETRYINDAWEEIDED